jgi:hypothetical protein
VTVAAVWAATATGSAITVQARMAGKTRTFDMEFSPYVNESLQQ